VSAATLPAGPPTSAPASGGADRVTDPMVAGRRSPEPPRIDGTPAAEVLRRLELSVTRRLDGLLQGDHRGLTPGHGSEPGEVRSYQPGDDVRRIDWNVTARSVEPHVRDMVADRELETWIVVDTSASLAYGTAGCEKRDLALAAVATVGFLTLRTGNRTGLTTLDGAGSAATLPARTGRVHLQSLLRRTYDDLSSPSPGALDLAALLRRAGGTARRRGLIVVVSDFLDGGDWPPALRALALRHDVLCAEVLDPIELELPDVGAVFLHDPETGGQIEVRTDGRLRERYAAAAHTQRLGIERAIRSSGADHLRLRTDRDWLLDVARFVSRRRDRVDSLSRATAHLSGAAPAAAVPSGGVR
jgi:uncharacterized protein (DUF58 family)